VRVVEVGDEHVSGDEVPDGPWDDRDPVRVEVTVRWHGGGDFAQGAKPAEKATAAGKAGWVAMGKSGTLGYSQRCLGSDTGPTGCQSHK
jgi:hypothetical protein